MLNKDLVEIVKSGVNPVIRIVKDKDYEGPDPGMLGQIIGVTDVDHWGRENSVIGYVIDFFQFHDVNTKLANPTFYDSSGVACLTWMQTKHYEKEAKNFTIYEMYTEHSKYAEIDGFEVFEPENKWFNMYLETNRSISYPRFLEDLLNKSKVNGNTNSN